MPLGRLLVGLHSVAGDARSAGRSC